MSNYPFGVTAMDIPGWEDDGSAELHECRECGDYFETEEPFRYCFEHYKTLEEVREEASLWAEKYRNLLAEHTALKADILAKGRLKG